MPHVMLNYSSLTNTATIPYDPIPRVMLNLFQHPSPRW